MPRLTRITSVSGTENPHKIVLSLDGVVENHTEITEVMIHDLEGNTLVSSSSSPTSWDFTNAGYFTVKFGLLNLPVGEYLSHRFIVKTATYPIGVSWDNLLNITILP